MHTASTASSSTSSLLPKPGVCTDCWVATAKGETSCLLVRSPVGTTRAQGVSRYWQTITTLSRNGHLVFVFIIQVLHNWDSRTEEHPRVEASACIPHSAFCAFCTLSNMFQTSRPFSKPVRRLASVVHPCFQCLLNPQALICCLVSHLVTLQLSSHLPYKGIVFPPEWRFLLIFLESNLILCKHLQASASTISCSFLNKFLVLCTWYHSIISAHHSLSVLKLHWAAVVPSRSTSSTGAVWNRLEGRRSGCSSLHAGPTTSNQRKGKNHKWWQYNKNLCCRVCMLCINGINIVVEYIISMSMYVRYAVDFRQSNLIHHPIEYFIVALLCSQEFFFQNPPQSPINSTKHHHPSPSLAQFAGGWTWVSQNQKVTQDI